MLVLTHTIGSVVHIGDDITLKIISINKNKIKVGYDAPKEVNILRDEVKQRQDKKYIECLACSGKGTTKYNGLCLDCEGTGRVQNGND